MKIALIGYGKMGHIIERIALERGHEIVSKVDVDNQEEFESEAFASADVAIEFTVPTKAVENYRKAWAAGVPVVSGTTGWNAVLPELKKEIAEKGYTLFWASNFSLGVNLFFELNKRLAAMMNRYVDYDVDMTEIHHTEKKDAPSGTAISLANDILARVERKNEWVNEPTTDAKAIEIVSLREGTVPGTHTVTYTSEDDKIEIKHTLFSRRALALGAVVAAEFVAPKKGVFTIDDLFE